jgi:hypothetical protein
MTVSEELWEEACEAVDENDLNRLKKLLSENKRLVHETGEDGETLLHNASLHGSPKVVQLLVQHGANLNAKDKYGGTPIHDAISGGNVEIVRTLASLGASMEIKDGYGWTPLWLAAWYDIRHTNHFFTRTCRTGNAPVAKILVELGASTKATGKWEGTCATLSELFLIFYLQEKRSHQLKLQSTCPSTRCMRSWQQVNNLLLFFCILLFLYFYYLLKQFIAEITL